ncbi:TPA: hypothetical protein N0F65_007648 [Lagenidium giganteum]|uniref:Tripeptidyl-peptidase 2 n=1 Tax=Lagenidium giganteum TaxID=4803 RepID=A0AAV2ZAH5_9STRA|nr:TPA: hypothetical protein N0F65_007648 [Lagenidium giganteum]
MPSFPASALLPKQDTLADRFLAQYPTYDGRNTIVAILDTGVDPGAAGLSVTSDGKPKIIDIVDATGSGDVDTSTVVTAANGELVLDDKRVLKLNPQWKTSADGTYHVGSVAAFELFPKPLVDRMKKARKEKFDIAQRAAVTAVQRDLAAWTAAHSTLKADDDDALQAKKDLDARLTVLADLEKAYDDAGPVYDCVVFHDGKHWRGAVSNEHGDFSDAAAMTDYKIEHQYGTFCSESHYNYALNIYDNGNTLSIVCDAGAHGTHVAGIVAAYHPDQPECNGVAPGAQIVAVKIGDTRLGSMETTSALSRALLAVVQAKCDIINMSYGEYAGEHNAGRIVELAQEIVDQHNVMYVCSAGNNAPALGTVGALGGTSSATLAVGAYVSPAMMDAEYTMREDGQAPIAYTWSSRGPTFDGDLGVDICAPGAAVAPVPTWTLNKKQLMNGTSMSSPNAAGNIALLMSALKDRQIAYTPYSVRRALAHTAVHVSGVERFAQGSGLLQVLPAFEYLAKHGNAFDGTRATPLHYKITVNHGPGVTGRGIFLRNAVDFVHESTEVVVDVTPVFHKLTTPADKSQFEMHLELVPTARWLDVGRHVALMHSGRGFKVLVQTKHLAYGEHFAEIQAFDTNHRARGQVFTIPVTIIKPEPVVVDTDGSAVVQFQTAMRAGEIVRRFVTPPADATWADVVVTRSAGSANDVARTDANGGAKLFALHALQFEPFVRQRESEFCKNMVLRPGDDASCSFNVVGGLTLELCLAQYWNALGDAHVTFQVRFHGIVPDQQRVLVAGGETSHRVVVRSGITKETLAPQVRFTNWVERVRPTKFEITPLSAARDAFPDERQVFGLVLTYSLTQKEDGKVSPRLPALHDRLYESAFEGQMCQVFDNKKRYVGCADAYREVLTLPKGEYTVLAQVRHEDVSKLEALKHTQLFVEHQVKEITANVFAHPDGATLGSKPLEQQSLPPHSYVAVYVGEPAADKLPTGCSPGDLLTGTVHFGKASTGGVAGAGRRPAGFPITYVVPAAETKPTPAKLPEPKDTRSEAEQEAEAVRDFVLARVTKLVGTDEFKAAWTRLAAQFPTHLKVLQARLHDADHEEHRRSRLDKVVVAADAVLAQIDATALAQYFGRRQAEPEKNKKQHQEQEDTNVMLIDALQRKARALGDQEGQGDAFAQVHAELRQWVDVDTVPAALRVALLADRRSKRHGLALQRLRKVAALDSTERNKVIPEQQVRHCILLRPWANPEAPKRSVAQQSSAESLTIVSVAVHYSVLQLEKEVTQELDALGWQHWQQLEACRQRQRVPRGYRPF